MPVQTLTLQQTAEVVTDLARGKTSATVAGRRHLPVSVVDQMVALYGPGRADLSRNAKVLNKKIRDQRPVEELDVDVPLSPASPPRRALEDAAHGYHDSGQALDVAAPAELQQLVAETQPVPDPDDVHLMIDETGEHTSTARASGCTTVRRARDEAVYPPVDEPAELTHVPLNGHDLGVATAQLVAELAAALPQFSPTDVEEVTGGVGAADSQGWMAPGERTIERLLDEASRTDSGRIRAQLDEVKEAISVLADLVDQWSVQAEQRAAIRRELEVLGRRQDELVAKLAALDALGPSVVTVQTSTGWREAKTDLLTTIPVDPEPAAVEPVLAAGKRPGLGALPFYRMSVEARRRCKEWAKSHGYKYAEKGQQPALTVAAFLAAHPEDDPR